jgi:hypothetical protein
MIKIKEEGAEKNVPNKESTTKAKAKSQKALNPI